MENKEELLTPEELSEILKVSLKAVKNWTQSGKIPGQKKIGRLWRYRKSEVLKQLITKNQFLTK